MASLRGGVDESALLPEERSLSEKMAPRRVATFAGGRLAMRRALAGLGIVAGPIGSTSRGAPMLPEPVVGSLSHKEDVAVALAALRAGTENIGVDLEVEEPLRVDISRRVCRPEEIEELGRLGDIERDARVRVTFAVKEAIYKAIDPVVQRYVAFDEVALVFEGESRVAAVLHLDPPGGDFRMELAYERIGGPHGEAMIVAFSRATPR
ncbi:MAG: 4'-phosphopantetheinyl transferase superfamily protein [Polyangiaceae bacterium]|nr:4'-phosphopantetheinyl transferase superfamily protein [Polyangiaceae bacterium]